MHSREIAIEEIVGKKSIAAIRVGRYTRKPSNDIFMSRSCKL